MEAFSKETIDTISEMTNELVSHIKKLQESLHCNEQYIITHSADLLIAMYKMFDALTDMHRETIKTAVMTMREHSAVIPVAIESEAEKDFITNSIKSFIEKLQSENTATN